MAAMQEQVLQANLSVESEQKPVLIERLSIDLATKKQLSEIRERINRVHGIAALACKALQSGSKLEQDKFLTFFSLTQDLDEFLNYTSPVYSLTRSYIVDMKKFIQDTEHDAQWSVMHPILQDCVKLLLPYLCIWDPILDPLDILDMPVVFSSDAIEAGSRGAVVANPDKPSVSDKGQASMVDPIKKDESIQAKKPEKTEKKGKSVRFTC